MLCDWAEIASVLLCLKESVHVCFQCMFPLSCTQPSMGKGFGEEDRPFLSIYGKYRWLLKGQEGNYFVFLCHQKAPYLGFLSTNAQR